MTPAKEEKPQKAALKEIIKYALGLPPGDGKPHGGAASQQNWIRRAVR
jgi:hypothetical protein